MCQERKKPSEWRRDREGHAGTAHRNRTETLYALATVGERSATESLHSFTCACVHIQQQRMHRRCCVKASETNDFSQPRPFAYKLFLCLSSVWLIWCAWICVCLTRACVMQKRLLKHACVTQRRAERRQTGGVLSDNDPMSLIINIYTPLSWLNARRE